MSTFGTLEDFFGRMELYFKLEPYYDFNTFFSVLEIEREEFIGFLEDTYGGINALAINDIEGMFTPESTPAGMYRLLIVHG